MYSLGLTQLLFSLFLTFLISITSFGRNITTTTQLSSYPSHLNGKKSENLNDYCSIMFLTLPSFKSISLWPGYHIYDTPVDSLSPSMFYYILIITRSNIIIILFLKIILNFYLFISVRIMANNWLIIIQLFP